MGTCVHFKDGKYRLFSSYTDEFITDWADEREIVKILREDAMSRFVQEVQQRLKRARENGCSLIPEMIRHKGSEV